MEAAIFLRRCHSGNTHYVKVVAGTISGCLSKAEEMNLAEPSRTARFRKVYYETWKLDKFGFRSEQIIKDSGYRY